LPVIIGLIDGLIKETHESLPAAVKELIVVAEELTRRWEIKNLDTSTPFVFSPVVDPRFKLLASLSETDKQLIKTIQINDLSGTVCIDPECVEVTDFESEGEPVKKKPKITALDKLLGPEKEEVSLTATEVLEQYLAEKVVKRKTNPLSWWKENEKRFPQLSKVARCLLNIPSTS